MAASPVLGRANPQTYSHAYRTHPPDRGRRPLGDHTRRAMGFRNCSERSEGVGYRDERETVPQ